MRSPLKKKNSDIEINRKQKYRIKPEDTCCCCCCRLFLNFWRQTERMHNDTLHKTLKSDQSA